MDAYLPKPINARQLFEIIEGLQERNPSDQRVLH